MRTNLPVTQRNYPVPEGTTIVTRTDAKGRIVHANEAFVQISGFTREELIGQPHNLVRHPDMPSEAFRDMWATLKAGRPWTGLVKNRRKDGGHYWVRANANPLPDGGYHSVRTAPSAQDVPRRARRRLRPLRHCMRACGRGRRLPCTKVRWWVRVGVRPCSDE